MISLLCTDGIDGIVGRVGAGARVGVLLCDRGVRRKEDGPVDSGVGVGMGVGRGSERDDDVGSGGGPIEPTGV